MRDLSRAPRNYELMAILTPDVPEEEIDGALNQIVSYIANAGGSVSETLQESPWGRRRLAYAIRHGGRDVRDGFYTLFHFELDPARVVELERELGLNDQVIRYLVTHHVPKPVDESAEEEEAAPAGEAAAEVAQAAESAEGEPTTEAAAVADTPEEVTVEEPAAEVTADDPAATSEEAVAEETAEEPPATTEEPVGETEEASDETPDDAATADSQAEVDESSDDENTTETSDKE